MLETLEVILSPLALADCSTPMISPLGRMVIYMSLRYDGLTGMPLPSAGNSSAIYVPENKALKRPIGITYVAIKVPEPEAAISLVAIGLLSSVLLKRREAKLE